MNVTTLIIWGLTVTNPSLFKGIGFDSAYPTSSACEIARQHDQGIETFRNGQTQYACVPVSWKGPG
jgi:hypothetical protein